jgi:16S rRNA (guanine(966)-N(2))-methyltransferase RsmD
VRETLFNWLGQDLGGWRCVDAFAGTGALGFEAASRGASSVLLVEQDAALVAQLHRLREKLNANAVSVQRGNGIAALRSVAPGALDLVFLDPPFDAGLFESSLEAAVPALVADGLVYLEAPDLWDAPRLASFGLEALRHLKAGRVHAHLLRRTA